MIEALRELLGDKSEIVPGAEIEGKLLADAMGHIKGKVQALVYAGCTEDVSRVMRYAYAHEIPVTARGAGTNLTGSAVPQAGGILLDLSRMKRILEIDRATFSAVAEPGVTLAEFQKAVEEQELFYPPDPGAKDATLGGNVSTNAGGMRAVKYGVTRDYIRGMELVLADGTVLELGGKTAKNSTGLNLQQLVIGAEGTLGIITRLTLRLIAKPKETAHMVISFDAFAQAVGAVNRLLLSGLQPTAIEFAERTVLALGERYTGRKFPALAGAAALILTFDDADKEALARRTKQAAALVLETGAGAASEITKPEDVEDLWKIRGALVEAAEAQSEQEPMDLAVPIDRLADFARIIAQVSEETGLQIVSFGHAGDGNIHLCIMRGELEAQAWQEKREAALDTLAAHTRKMGGVLSGEHGIGICKKRLFQSSASGEEILLMQRVKRAFDEKGILNPGQSYLPDIE